MSWSYIMILTSMLGEHLIGSCGIRFGLGNLSGMIPCQCGDLTPKIQPVVSLQSTFCLEMGRTTATGELTYRETWRASWPHLVAPGKKNFNQRDQNVEMNKKGISQFSSLSMFVQEKHKNGISHMGSCTMKKWEAVTVRLCSFNPSLLLLYIRLAILFSQ